MILIVPVTGNHTLLNTLLFFTLYYLASYLQKTITGDRGSLTSTDGAGGLEKDTVNLVASFETALVVMPEKERLERIQNTPSLICILPSSLKERDIENNTFNSYANK